MYEGRGGYSSGRGADCDVDVETGLRARDVTCTWARATRRERDAASAGHQAKTAALHPSPAPAANTEGGR